MDTVIQFLVVQFPVLGLILAGLGALVVTGQAIVLITPSKADDAAWEKLKGIPLVGQIVSVLVNFAPIQKK